MNCGFYTLFLQCLSGDGGRLPAELCKLPRAGGRAAVGRLGGGDGCEQIVSAASRTGWRSGPGLLSRFPSSLQNPKQRERVRLGGAAFAPYRGKAGVLKAEAGPQPWGGFGRATAPSGLPTLRSAPQNTLSRSCQSSYWKTAQLSRPLNPVTASTRAASSCVNGASVPLPGL